MGKMLNLASASAIAALMAAPAFAQDASQWDADQNQSVSQDEFNTGMGETETFGTWDADQSGSVSQEEFDQGVTGGFDRDVSGDLNEEEQAQRDESDWGNADMTSWDTDQSGDLNEDEFNQGVFGQYDQDQSGDWNEDEWSLFQDDAGEEGFWDW